MQLRRVMLLFTLVLGLSALVAALVPPPPERSERRERSRNTTAPAQAPRVAARPRELRLAAPPERGDVPLRRVPAGARLSLSVTAADPGDIELAGLGLRQSAHPRAPARFELLALPAGRHDVVYHPVRGRSELIARLRFVGEATVKRRERRP